MAHLSSEAKALIKAFTTVTVKHDHLTCVDDELSLLVEEHTDATHVLLCGPGGVGKSKVLKVVAERFKDEELGCSFTEVIVVTLTQMEEAGVSRFECPTCLAVRDIKPKGNHVKFPSHPKRMTNTPNQGSRWVKRESLQRLSR